MCKKSVCIFLYLNDTKAGGSVILCETAGTNASIIGLVVSMNPSEIFANRSRRYDVNWVTDRVNSQPTWLGVVAESAKKALNDSRDIESGCGWVVGNTDPVLRKPLGCSPESLNNDDGMSIWLVGKHRIDVRNPTSGIVSDEVPSSHLGMCLDEMLECLVDTLGPSVAEDVVAILVELGCHNLDEHIQIFRVLKSLGLVEPLVLEHMSDPVICFPWADGDNTMVMLLPGVERCTKDCSRCCGDCENTEIGTGEVIRGDFVMW